MNTKLLKEIKQLLDQQYSAWDELVPDNILSIYELLEKARKEKAVKAKVFISMDGGLIQGVCTSTNNIDVIVADYDQLHRVGDDEKDDKWLASINHPDVDPETMQDGDEVPDTVFINHYPFQKVKGKFYRMFTDYKMGWPKYSSDCKEKFVREWLKKENL